MPQLDTLMISLLFPVSNRDMDRQLVRTPIMTHVTLANLRCFHFGGVCAYREAVVRRITAPRLTSVSSSNSFFPFHNARQNAGRTVTLVLLVPFTSKLLIEADGLLKEASLKLQGCRNSFSRDNYVMARALLTS
jgi:hypothetical protein